MTQTALDIPAPEVTPDAKPYWDAARAGKLLIKHCNGCGENYHYPRPFCPFCMSDDTQWVESAGEGIIYSYTVLRRHPALLAPALITLDEGPTVLSALFDSKVDSLAIGQRVQVIFIPTTDGPPIPMFRPSTSIG